MKKLLLLFVLMLLPNSYSWGAEPTVNQETPVLSAQDLELAKAAVEAKINLRCNTSIIEIGADSFYQLTCQADVYGIMQFDAINSQGAQQLITKSMYTKDSGVLLSINDWIILARFISSEEILVFQLIPISVISEINRV